jgi:hypothetical protein
MEEVLTWRSRQDREISSFNSFWVFARKTVPEDARLNWLAEKQKSRFLAG